MTERWAEILDFPLYEVSDLGRVRSFARSSEGKILRPKKAGKGYRAVCLGRRNYRYIHRLVLQSFVGECPEGMEGCHGDGDKANNSLENLRWDYPSENNRDKAAHGTDHGRNKESCPREHALEEPNLVAHQWARGHRSCRACAQARAWVQRHPEVDFKAESNRRYKEILAA